MINQSYLDFCKIPYIQSISKSETKASKHSPKTTTNAPNSNLVYFTASSSQSSHSQRHPASQEPLLEPPQGTPSQ